jgi:hypothetical protein
MLISIPVLLLELRAKKGRKSINNLQPTNRPTHMSDVRAFSSQSGKLLSILHILLICSLFVRVCARG